MKKQLFTSNRQDWETPQQLFDQLDATEHFTLDAACSPANCKCATGYTIGNSGLTHTSNVTVRFLKGRTVPQHAGNIPPHRIKIH